jgi:hypothetical protein
MVRNERFYHRRSGQFNLVLKSAQDVMFGETCVVIGNQPHGSSDQS